MILRCRRINYAKGLTSKPYNFSWRHFISDALGISLDETKALKRLEVHLANAFLLNKHLSGTGRMDDGIQLFNARTKEELDMLEVKTRNAGILEAIKEVKIMSFGKTLRALHEARTE